MTKPANNARKCADHRVRSAEESDIGVLSQVIADAFHGLLVSEWLIPDPDERNAVLPGYFRIYVEQAFTEGLVLTTVARDAVALWMPIGRDGPAEAPEGYQRLLAGATGSHLSRFQALDAAFEQHHPRGIPHEHLAMMAVRPDRQRLGIGTALLNHHHEVLDGDHIPAYLEASDLAKRGIYLAHGYVDLGEPIQLPDGPKMYPMIRFPGNGAGAAVKGRM